MGFFIQDDAIREMLKESQRSSEVLFPYLSGDDLNSQWNCSASRHVINFGSMTEAEARQYSRCWKYAEEHVFPSRLDLPESSYPGLMQRWWQYWRLRDDMSKAIADLDQVIAITVVSKTGIPTIVSASQVFSNALVVFATADPSVLAMLSSSLHFFWWTTIGESSLRTDPRYTPTDGFGKLPMPQPTLRMTQAGQSLHSFRRGIMQSRKLGLTPLYALFNNPSVIDRDVLDLRSIHVEVDEAVREAYASEEEQEPGIGEFETRVASAPLPAWREIELRHGFHETRQGVRFTITPQARIDVLDKLLALNHYRYRQEQEHGLHNKKSARKKRPAAPSNVIAPGLNDGALFPPPDALF